MRCRLGFIFLFLVLVLPNPVSAQIGEAAIAARLAGKPLYLRGWWLGDKLKFDGAGVPVGRPAVGSFTVSGMTVEKVALGTGELKLEGTRAGIRFVNGLPERVALPDRPGQKPEKIRIEIKTPAGGDYKKALDEIFATTLEEMVPTLPDYWQAYAREHLVHGARAGGAAIEDYVPESVETPAPGGGSTGLSAKDTPAYSRAVKIGGGVKAPVPIRMPDPRFSHAARESRLSGNALVYLWVDPKGMPTHVRVVRPVGLGLDEAAVDAVSDYLFKPAVRVADGVPVTVEMNVEVNFQIF